MDTQDWLDRTTEAFRRRLSEALEAYRRQGLDLAATLGSPEELGEEAARVVWPSAPDVDTAPERSGQ